MNNISGLTQKLHDLIHCRESILKSQRSRAEFYFQETPTKKNIEDLADKTAKEIANLFLDSSSDRYDREKCIYALRNCGYDQDGNRLKNL